MLKSCNPLEKTWRQKPFNYPPILSKARKFREFKLPALGVWSLLADLLLKGSWLLYVALFEQLSSTIVLWRNYLCSQTKVFMRHVSWTNNSVYIAWIQSKLDDGSFNLYNNHRGKTGHNHGKLFEKMIMHLWVVSSHLRAEQLQVSVRNLVIDAFAIIFPI